MSSPSRQLRSNFLLTGVAAAVVLAGGVAIVGSQDARRTLTRVADTRARELARQHAVVTSATMDERRRELERLAANPMLVEAVRRAGQLDSAGLARERRRDPAVDELLREYTRHSELSDLVLTDNRGLIVAASAAAPAGAPRPRDEEWWQSAKRDGSFEGAPRFDAASGRASVPYAVRVSRTGAPPGTGVLRSTIGLDRLSRVLNIGSEADSEFIDVIDTSLSPVLRSQAPVLDRAAVVASRATPLRVARGAHGSELIAAALANRGRWMLLFRQPTSRAYAIVGATERNTSLWAVALLFLAILLVWRLARWVETRITDPVRAAGAVAGRIAGGDLSVAITGSDALGAGGAARHGEVDELLTSVQSMVLSLRKLVGAIRSAADEAAAMASEISASTEQMSASTEQMSATCQDLSRRAGDQAQLVRAAAEDTHKMLEIVTVLAAGAEDSVRRNTNLSTLARRNREVLDQSTARLAQLADEVTRGVTEADALVRASEEIQKFVTQAKAIATQTNMLALNAAIEAARAGPQGRGFAVVADEVRKLAALAAAAAGETAETVRLVLARVETTRERLGTLAQGSAAAREAAQTAAQGLAAVSAEAAANDAWSREIARSMAEARSLIEEITGRLNSVAQGTDGLLASSEEIAASSEEQSASTEEIAASANQLAEASDRLSEAVKSFRLLSDQPPDRQAAAD